MDKIGIFNPSLTDCIASRLTWFRAHWNATRNAQRHVGWMCATAAYWPRAELAADESHQIPYKGRVLYGIVGLEWLGEGWIG